MRRHARLIVNAASGGLILVFIALIVFTALGARTIQQAADRTVSADALSHRYEYVERELWKEASLVRVHGLNPLGSDWNSNIQEERDAANVIETSLTGIEGTGSADDKGLARDILADHDRYTDMLHVLFAQIDASAPEAAQTFTQSTRLFDKMQAGIDRRASEQHDAAIASLSELGRTQRYIVRMISLGALLAGVLLLAAAFLIQRYRRVIEAARKNELERLTAASQTDTLTGLGNHRAYQDELARDLALLKRRGGVVTLALIDVDEFKRVNDTKGHIYGDHVLVTLAQSIGALRPSDRGFRLGGDEFAIVLPYTDAIQAFAAMERLRQDAAAKTGRNDDKYRHRVVEQSRYRCVYPAERKPTLPSTMQSTMEETASSPIRLHEPVNTHRRSKQGSLSDRLAARSPYARSLSVARATVAQKNAARLAWYVCSPGAAGRIRRRPQ